MKQFHLLKSLYNDYKEELFRFALRYVQCREQAQDIVQDTFHNMMAVENLGDFDNPRAYLYRTARNLSLNHHRGSHRQSQAIDSLALNEEENTPALEQYLLAQHELKAVAEAIELLPATTKNIFYLSRVEDNTYKEISEKMRISVSSVEKHMMKALKKIRIAVEEG